MVVEDELSLMEMMKDIFDLEEIESVGVSRPEMVLSVARTFRPQLFLIDIMLLGMSGIEVAQALRKNEFADTPMIAMSASHAMLDYADESGVFDGRLPKPFEVEALLSLVQRMLQRAPGNP